ncbi:hypothetical protein AOX55_00006839 (plasmid) [Sinorhizobium fredii CCBAU 25509]|nr:hypothetical protein AOX55_00006839 [Sinorhizobium fredii CCBAU 25509]
MVGAGCGRKTAHTFPHPALEECRGSSAKNPCKSRGCDRPSGMHLPVDLARCSRHKA